MTPFPWPDAMQFGFGVLRLAPADFWAMTPRELATAFKAHHREQTSKIDRETMAKLMQKFPDKEVRHGGYR